MSAHELSDVLRCVGFDHLSTYRATARTRVTRRTIGTRQGRPSLQHLHRATRPNRNPTDRRCVRNRSHVSGGETPLTGSPTCSRGCDDFERHCHGTDSDDSGDNSSDDRRFLARHRSRAPRSARHRRSLARGRLPRDSRLPAKPRQGATVVGNRSDTAHDRPDTPATRSVELHRRFRYRSVGGREHEQIARARGHAVRDLRRHAPSKEAEGRSARGRIERNRKDGVAVSATDSREPDGYHVRLCGSNRCRRAVRRVPGLYLGAIDATGARRCCISRSESYSSPPSPLS